MQNDSLERGKLLTVPRRRALKLIAGAALVPVFFKLGAFEYHTAVAGGNRDPYPTLSAKERRDRCGTRDFRPASAARAGTRAEMAQFKKRGKQLAADQEFKTIRVAFHIILSDLGEYDATDAQVEAQVDAMNTAYAPTGIRFQLVQLDRTRNSEWLRPEILSKEEKKTVKALSVDPVHTLNIFSCIPGGGFLGWGYFPWTYQEKDIRSCVFIQTGTIPGVFPNDWGEGKTAVHEIGHYLGVYHTFEGGCTDPGDYCADTPSQAEPDYECLSDLDTCAGGGLDAIHNYMNYTPDACMDQFTADQIARMHWALATYRPSLTSG